MIFNKLLRFFESERGLRHGSAGRSAAGPLHVRLHGRELRFATPRDFAFALAGRSAVPASAVALDGNSVNWDGPTEWNALEREASELSRLLGGAGLRNALLARGAARFSTDNDWRDLFGALLARAPLADGYLELALVRYIEYLRARQDALRLAIAISRRDEIPRAEPVRETSDLSLLQRLPHGRAVSLRLEQGREVTIALARHRFALTHDRDWTLVADGGRRYVLRAGVNSIGRSRENSIAVDAALRHISRTHLLLEPIDAETVKLTDLSSEGTYIQPTAQAS